MNNYEDIISLDHYNPRFHPRMSIYNRSAQFAPFAALTGYEDAVIEASRLTDRKLELNEDYNQNLNIKLSLIEQHIKEKPMVRVLNFVKDRNKEGGKYMEYLGNLKRIDLIKKELIFADRHIIKLDCILDINLEENYSI